SARRTAERRPGAPDRGRSVHRALGRAPAAQHLRPRPGDGRRLDGRDRRHRPRPRPGGGGRERARRRRDAVPPAPRQGLPGGVRPRGLRALRRRLRVRLPGPPGALVRRCRLRRRVWLERFRWAVPHYLTFGPLAYAVALAYDRMGLLGLGTFAVPPILLGLTMRLYLEHTRASVEEGRSVNDELVASNERVHRTYLSTIAALSRAIEAKDDYSGGHVERVRALSVELARMFGFTGVELEAIEVGAL